MAEAAQLLSAARAEVAAERGAEALRTAQAALDAFKRIDSESGIAEASSVLISSLTLNGRAAEAVEMVSDLSKRSTDQTQIRQLDILKAEALLAQGRYADALKLAESIEEVSKGREDQKNVGWALLASAKAHLAMGSSKRAVEASEKAAKGFISVGDDRGEAAAWTSVMNARFAAGDYEGGDSARKCALALYGELGDSVGEAIVFLKFSKVQIKRRYFSEAIEAASHAVSFFRKNGGGKLEIDALDVVVHGLLSSGGSAKAMSLAKQSVASARRCSSQDNEGRALLALAQAQMSENMTDAAYHAANDACSIFNELGDKAAQARSLQMMARAHYLGYRFDSAQEAAEAALKLYREVADLESAAVMEKLQTDIKDAEEKDNNLQLQAYRDYESQREYELGILADVANHIRSRLTDGLKEKFDQIRSSSVLTDADYKNVIGDSEADMWWLYSKIGYRKDSEPSRHTLVDHRDLYHGFRSMGMHYGPGFRLMQFAGAQGTNPVSAQTYGLLTLFAEGREPNHEWEELSWFHPGILDVGLQTGGARSFLNPTSSLYS